MKPQPDLEAGNVQQCRDDVVDRLRQQLRQEIRDSDLTQRAVEDANGFNRGYLSQVLKGHVTLTARHLFGIVLALGISPEAFLRRTFGYASQSNEVPLSEIRERMARYDSALKELEEKGVLAPYSPVAGGPDMDHES